MPKYVIERDLAGAGRMSKGDLEALSRKSCGVLEQMGPKIQWLQTYVSGDKLYCVYISPDEAMVREHARRGEFPVTRVAEVKAIIDPTTGEG